MKILVDDYSEFDVYASESKNGCHNLVIYPTMIPIIIPKYLIKDHIEEHSDQLQKIKIPDWFLKKNRIIPLNS